MSSPTTHSPPPFRKPFFACFRFFLNFHPFFQAGQLTPFAPMCGRPCGHGPVDESATGLSLSPHREHGTQLKLLRSTTTFHRQLKTFLFQSAYVRETVWWSFCDTPSVSQLGAQYLLQIGRYSALQHTRHDQTEQNWSLRTGFLYTCFPRECSQRTNWLSTNRPNCVAANQVVTLMRATNERVM